MRHITASGNGTYVNSAFPSGVITLSGTPTFSDAFVVAATAGVAQFNSDVTFVGTFTGKRYRAYDNGIIATYPSTSTTWLPGTIAGTVDNGGVYHGPTVNDVGIGAGTGTSLNLTGNLVAGNATLNANIAGYFHVADTGSSKWSIYCRRQQRRAEILRQNSGLVYVANNIEVDGGINLVGQHILISTTPPTIASSGCTTGSAQSVSANNGTAAFKSPWGRDLRLDDHADDACGRDELGL